MSKVNVRVVYEAQCDTCGQIKRNEDRLPVIEWADAHNCAGRGYFAADATGLPRLAEKSLEYQARNPRAPYTGE